MLYLYSLSSKLLQTTDTLDSAMAAEPIQGCIFSPRGENTPAAMGMPTCHTALLYWALSAHYGHSHQIVHTGKHKV